MFLGHLVFESRYVTDVDPEVRSSNGIFLSFRLTSVEYGQVGRYSPETVTLGYSGRVVPLYLGRT